MSREHELVVGFSDSEIERIEAHLERLLPHLQQGEFAIVGGLAIRYHLIKKGFEYPPHRFNDLDLIVQDRESIRPSIINDFLIYHYHPIGESDVYIALVDREQKIKTDIFPWNSGPEILIPVPFGKGEVLLASPEDQLAKTVADLQKVNRETRVDPKQFADARLLMQVANFKITSAIWDKKFKEKYKLSLVEALHSAEDGSERHADLVVAGPYRKPEPYVCEECVNVSEFPLASMKEIYRILGYIE